MRRAGASLAGRLLSQVAREAFGCCRSAAAETLQPQSQQWWQAGAAHLQRAGVRTRHAPKPHHAAAARPRRGLLARSLTAVGKAAGLAAVGAPVAGVAALLVVSRGQADAAEVVGSLPRTARVVWWGAWATYKYKALAARHASDPGSPAYEHALAELHQVAASKLLLVCQSNGGIYIKAGQLMVSLNAVPPAYRSILEALQDKVPPRPFADVDCTLLRELGAPAEALFAEFAPLATAAASLAQVHRATLHDGTVVAVKVQYPGLEAAVAADLATMLALADASHRLFPATSWRWLFEELRRQLAQELDFGNEARNAARLAACMAGRPDIAVPRTFPHLCTPRVLTMEWVEGCKVTDVECLEQQGLQPRAVGVLLLDAFAAMTYSSGFIHGDPHPGNILVRPRPDPPPRLLQLLGGQQPRPQLVLLDHGVYITLPDHLRRLYCQLWSAIVLADWETARQAATELAGEKAGRILPEILRPRVWSKVPPEERRRVREQSGITSFEDFAKLLEAAPKALLDSLRQSTIVRHSATLLGATIGDRLRVNAKWAQRGLYVSTDGERQPLQFVGRLQSRLVRWRLALHVGLLRLAFWLSSALHTLTAYAVPLAE